MRMLRCVERNVCVPICDKGLRPDIRVSASGTLNAMHLPPIINPHQSHHTLKKPLPDAKNDKRVQVTSCVGIHMHESSNPRHFTNLTCTRSTKTADPYFPTNTIGALPSEPVSAVWRIFGVR